MKKELIVRLHQSFDAIANEKNGVEYWLARELQTLLEYTEWRNFVQVIDKAKTTCITAGQAISDHFVDVNKMVPLGSGSERNNKGGHKGGQVWTLDSRFLYLDKERKTRMC
ncbi:MAG: hypothetical protein V2A66_03465 [Pseudomonadota bacterium]